MSGLNLKKKLGIQPALREHFANTGAVGVPFGTPVDSAKAAAIMSDDVFGLIGNDDTVEFDGNTFTKVASGAGDNEFENAVGLEDLLDDLDNWDASESSSTITVTAAQGGARWNGYNLVFRKLEDTTSGGAVSSAATAEIDDATTAQMANGDVVWFYGRIYTKAAATDVSEREFEDAAGLIDCIDAAPEWGAADTSGEITITAVADGEEWNGEEVLVIFNRPTANGVDGTEAYGRGAVMVDADRIYVCTDGGAISDVTWKRSANELVSL